MTTNNPPIAAWAPSTALAKLASRHNNAPCVLTDTPAQFNDVALVRLSDYEELKEELESLRTKTSTSLGVGDGTGNLFVHGDYDSIKRVQALIFEFEKLRKDAERYQWLRNGCDQKASEATRIAANCYGLEWDAAIDKAMQEKDNYGEE